MSDIVPNERNADYCREYAMDKARVIEFLESTQPEKMVWLSRLLKAQRDERIFAAINSASVGKGDAKVLTKSIGQIRAMCEANENLARTAKVSTLSQYKLPFWLNRKNVGYWRWRVPGQGIVLRDLPDGKRHGEAVIAVPEGVDGLQIQFRLRPDPGKTCGFDKVFLGKVRWDLPILGRSNASCADE